MLKKLKNLFTSSNPESSAEQQALRVPQATHRINTQDISSGALRVISELQDQHFEAYLVGGGVRDLILGGRPKDFDVATDATPEQVQSVFRRAKIIGRRFKIVHVRMGREIIEVTTFRGAHKDAGPQTKNQKLRKGKTQHAVQNEKGMLLRDNVYGDLKSDAYRRDFTINALYFDPSTEEVIDYTGGMADMQSKTLRLIGDADARYKEDPVRMLRAIRFHCKLGFELDAISEKPIYEHSDYLLDVPSARLFEEVLKLFMSGKASELLEVLDDYNLLEHLFPAASRALESEHTPHHRALLRLAARNTDKRIMEGKRVTPAFIYAAFMWPALQLNMTERRNKARASDQELMMAAASDVISEQLQRTSIPKRFLIPMREIWSLQLRFHRRDPKRTFALLEHPRFRAAYDFLLLREECGELPDSTLGAWWTRIQKVDREEQLEMIKAADKPSSRRRSRSHRKKRTHTEQNTHGKP